VSGEESESFLQGQLSQDLTALSASGRWSLLLRPDSAVLTTVFVRPYDQGFELLVPRPTGEVALARLQRFHLRVKCTLELGEAPSGPINTVQELVSLSWPGYREFVVELTPQSYGATFVEKTISFTKGCYTGQELVARLDSRGSSVPWRFVKAVGPSVERVEEVLKSKGPAGPQGVTTAVARNAGFECLGFAHRTLLSGGGESAHGDVALHAIG
jgi:folate-binding protein YgfZ